MQPLWYRGEGFAVCCFAVLQQVRQWQRQTGSLTLPRRGDSHFNEVKWAFLCVGKLLICEDRPKKGSNGRPKKGVMGVERSYTPPAFLGTEKTAFAVCCVLEIFLFRNSRGRFLPCRPPLKKAPGNRELGDRMLSLSLVVPPVNGFFCTLYGCFPTARG